MTFITNTFGAMLNVENMNVIFCRLKIRFIYFTDQMDGIMEIVVCTIF